MEDTKLREPMRAALDFLATPAGADFAADFDGLAGAVGADDPRIVLFTAGAQAGGVSPGTALEWGLLSYVPDTANVRLKMLYASSKDALKKALNGVQEEYQATERGDLDETEVNKKAGGNK